MMSRKRPRKTKRIIDAAIARHAETETLYDQPYEDKKTVRVSGPFTVESLSPHRTISAEEKTQRSEVGRDGWKMKVHRPGLLCHDDPRQPPQDGRAKHDQERTPQVRFARSVSPAEWIHAQGWNTECLSLTPTLSQRARGRGGGPPSASGRNTAPSGAMIKEAAKEAVRGVGFDMLLVCGFAFDPSVSEEAKRGTEADCVAGADEPQPAEIDEAAWLALDSTTKPPLAPPETGKIAVKVINHYGDEVLKVFDVETATPPRTSADRPPTAFMRAACAALIAGRSAGPPADRRRTCRTSPSVPCPRDARPRSSLRPKSRITRSPRGPSSGGLAAGRR